MKKTLLFLVVFIVFAVIVNGTKDTFQTLVLAGLTAIFVRIIIEGVD